MFPNRCYKLLNEYTFKEMLDEKALTNYLSIGMEEMILSLSNNEINISQIISDYEANRSLYDELNSYLINRYLYELILSIEYLDPSNLNLLIEEYMKEWCYSFLSILRQTYKRYTLLLKLYDDTRNKLLDPIKSETGLDSRFNDTPQDEGAFDDATHNTNVSQTKGIVKNDRDTIIERIDDITKKYRNLLHDWSDEFRGIFIERR